MNWFERDRTTVFFEISPDREEVSVERKKERERGMGEERERFHGVLRIHQTYRYDGHRGNSIVFTTMRGVEHSLVRGRYGDVGVRWTHVVGRTNLVTSLIQ